jgi:hypothetical protein
MAAPNNISWKKKKLNKIFKSFSLKLIMPKKSSKNISSKKVSERIIDNLDASLNNLSRDELRELILINTYKLALTRAQVDAIMDVLIKKGITSYDEVWKKTNEIFKETKKE